MYPMVNGRDGSSAEDSVRVIIANQLPFIAIDEPPDNFITDESIITVRYAKAFFHKVKQKSVGQLMLLLSRQAQFQQSLLCLTL